MRQTDDKTRRLMELLSQDSRAPLKVLGAELGLSVSAVQERIARLRRDGVIAGFTIRTTGEETPGAAYILVATEARQCAEVAPRLTHIPEILACHSVAGEIDLVLQIGGADAARLQRIRDEIAALDGVTRVTTLPVLVERFARAGGTARTAGAQNRLKAT